MKSKVVAILETRTGAHLAELVASRGGIPMLAPALAEVADMDSQAVVGLLERWHREPFSTVIFQTGVGTQALFAATDELGATGELTGLLAPARVVVRGPKPVGALNLRGVRIDIRAPAPFTTETVLSSLSHIAVCKSKILVQRYGVENERLRDALQARGARVEEIATYRWALPQDCAPVVALLDALAHSRVDAVLFTSAIQMKNLHTIAQQNGYAQDLATHLNRVVVASIGPVCSRMLREFGVMPTLEANPPKLGPLLTAVDEALSSTPPT